ncbi:hypothetical protein BRE01_37410 [Brevibacillus reuszeri]|uniref:Uncharacterized protein n=1 Tax=Brevibacillus reuszeri TaxID=54915 RepID=A0A0K9YPE0_9BACL|nr:hypothetical protein [Brevibacillus reuszeri]KNB70541.1 hypothetical protein ADS79_16635 [Brevibacillus reuszeri]MED1861493.1 hypothetical protein [Brevibacillus reuszeri]GED70039.1 hypothetical protein BRE01_37410 [Brevibacillus reuszeri]
MTVDLRGIKAIDVHAHSYLLQSTQMTVTEIVQKLSLSVLPDMFKETNCTNPKIPFSGTNMYMQITMQRLAKFFSCEPIA